MINYYSFINLLHSFNRFYYYNSQFIIISYFFNYNYFHYFHSMFKAIKYINNFPIQFNYNFIINFKNFIK